MTGHIDRASARELQPLQGLQCFFTGSIDKHPTHDHETLPLLIKVYALAQQRRAIEGALERCSFLSVEATAYLAANDLDNGEGEGEEEESGEITKVGVQTLRPDAVEAIFEL